jgi:hypothetical protein
VAENTQREKLRLLLSEGEELLAEFLTPEELRSLEQEAGLAPRESGGYVVQDGGFARARYTKKGDVIHEPLSNFTAEIKEEISYDDGAERSLYFLIAGELQGRPLPPVQVPAEKFPSLSWVAQSWGAKALVYPGQSTKDHLRFAIQLHSKNLRHREVYAHTGWRNINGKWCFLHSGGAITAGEKEAGIEVALPEKLRNYLLPDPPEDGRGFRESLAILDLAPERITAPLLGAVYLAPLGEILPLDFSLFLCGRTGGFKTELATLAITHFGKWNSRTLPENWESTANSLERTAFLAKDVVFVVDDFVPRGGKSDLQQLHIKADRLLRGAANRAGRGRMRSDGGLAPEYYPRGLVIATGEDAPFGQSLRARMVIVEVLAPSGGTPGDVDVTRLTSLQREAQEGKLSLAMAGYLRWLAERMETLRSILPQRRRELRQFFKSASHLRSPDIGAALLLSWETLLGYARERNLLSENEREALWKRAVQGITEAMSQQEELQREEDPVERFLDLIAGALLSGRAYLIRPDGGKPENAQALGWQYDGEHWLPRGDRLGAINPPELYLFPDVAYSVAQKMAAEQGHTLGVSSRTLGKRLAERNLLLTYDEKGYTTKRLIAGTKVRVYVSPSDTLWRGTPLYNIRDIRDQSANSDVERVLAPRESENFEKLSGTKSGTDPEQTSVPFLVPDVIFESGTKNEVETLDFQGSSRKSRMSRKITHTPLPQGDEVWEIR